MSPLNRSLPFLLSTLLAAQGPTPVTVTGGGTVFIGSRAYAFVAEDFLTAPAKAGAPGALRIKGRLMPEKGDGAFRLELTVLRDGTLYMLNLRRQVGRRYPDTWNATTRTRVRVLMLDDRPGGRVELAFQGPLAGVIAQKPASAVWSGSLWIKLSLGRQAP